MSFIVSVGEDSELAGESLAYLLDMSGAGHRQTEAPLGAHRQPMQLGFRQYAVFVALAVRHWRQHELVFHGLAAWEINRFASKRDAIHVACPSCFLLW
jgi:hypothetical protein